MKNIPSNPNPRLETFHFDDSTYRKVVEYARESVQYYATFGRSQGDVVKHIVLGKLGEVVYYWTWRNAIVAGSSEILKVNKPEKGRAWGTDKGWDFDLVSGARIDVKAIEEGKKKLYFNEPLKADYLAICVVDPFLRKGRYLATIGKDQLDEIKVLYKEQGKRKVYYIELSKLNLNLEL